MRRTLTVIAVFGVTIALLFARAPDALRVPQFWAEDAVIFWSQQYERGFLASLLVPSAGYLHIMPRVIAALADWLPYPMHPAAFIAGAAVATGWTAATIAGLALPLPLAALLGVAVVLAAPTGETFTNPTNVQWIMAPALPLIAATAPPAGRLARANQLAFVALSGLSGPFSILMIPIWLWCVVSGARRDGLALVLTATTVLAGAAQAIVIVGDAGNPGRATRLAARTLGRPAACRHRTVRCQQWVQDVPDREHRASRGCGARRICPPPSRLHGVGGLAGIGGGVEVPHGAGLARCFRCGSRYFQIPAVMIAFCAITLLFEKGIVRLIGIVGCVALAHYAGKRFVRTPIPDQSEDWTANSPEIGKRPMELRVSPDWILRIAAPAALGALES